MATLAYSSRWGAYVPSWGPDAAETEQQILVADGWKTMIPHKIFVETVSIDDGAGTITVPFTGIYYVRVGMVGFQAGFDSLDLTVRIRQNGSTVLAQGFNYGSAGTDCSMSVAVYSGCLTAGDTLQFQGAATSFENATHVVGYATIIRMPSPFTIVDLLSGPINSKVEWETVCDLPAWFADAQPTKLTVPSTGYYFLGLKTLAAQNNPSTWWRDARIYVNGVDANQECANPAYNGNIPLLTVLSLTAGDYVEIYINNEAGTPSFATLTTADLAMFKIPGTVVGAQIYKSFKTWTASPSQLIDFNSSIFDTSSFWAGGTSPYLTVPAGKAGKYLVWAQALVDATRASNWSLNCSDGIQYINGASGTQNAHLHSRTSPCPAAIWDLAVGDRISFYLQDGDAGGGGGPALAYDIRMGMVNIDGWTYQSQRGCPCPNVWELVSFDFELHG